MPRHPFVEGRSYRITQVIGQHRSPHVGRLLTITRLGPESAHLPASAIICHGTIGGVEYHFPAGIRLAEPFETCYCSRWPFPHRRGQRRVEEI